MLLKKVHSKLIGRSPGSHRTLNDGLVLVRKSRDRSQKRTKSSQGHKSFSKNRSLSRSHSLNRSQSQNTKTTRQARSHSPSLNRENNPKSGN